MHNLKLYDIKRFRKTDTGEEFVGVVYFIGKDKIHLIKEKGDAIFFSLESKNLQYKAVHLENGIGKQFEKMAMKRHEWRKTTESRDKVKEELNKIKEAEEQELGKINREINAKKEELRIQLGKYKNARLKLCQY